jgi:hypothetical protein
MDLETVKEHFKNAKEVECLFDNGVLNITKKGVFINDPMGFKFVESREDFVRLYYFEDNQFAKIISYKDISENVNNAEPKIILEGGILTPEHYNNENGTLYKVAAQRNWNPYLFDIVKRLERADKKGEFESDLNKSIAVIQLWLKESKNDN